MATLEDLLEENDIDYIHDDITFVIDSDLRIITIPEKGVVAGVVGDKNVNRINFQMVRYYNGFDMSKFLTRVNYVNANGDPNYYNVNDVTVEDDYILFTWLIDRDAVAYVGDLVFAVRMLKVDETGTITNDFNTRNDASLYVFDGLQVEDAVSEDEKKDILEHLKFDMRVYARKMLQEIDDSEAKAKQSISEYVEENKANLKGDPGNVYFASFKVVKGRLKMYANPEVDKIRFIRYGSRLSYRVNL